MENSKEVPQKIKNNYQMSQQSNSYIYAWTKL